MKLNVGKIFMKHNVTYNVGKVKYLVSYYDGIKRHKDGSEAWDVKLFSNKKLMNSFIKTISN